MATVKTPFVRSMVIVQTCRHVRTTRHLFSRLFSRDLVMPLPENVALYVFFTNKHDGTRSGHAI
jgi:hypothetical protein